MAKSVKNKKRRVSPTLRVSDSKEPEQAIEATKRSAFSGWPMIIGWLAMLIFTFHACTHMVAAGDTWVAMACGRHFVNRGKVDNNPLPFRVDTIEPFSANSHKPGPTEEEIQSWPGWAQWITDKVGIETVKYWHPTGWIDQNWLTQVIFYSLIPKSSYADGVSFPSNALVYWKFAIYILTVICVYYTARLLGINPALCAVFSCFAMFAGRSFLDIRPAGFSNMLVAVFLLILALTTYRNVLYIWLIIPVTVFWCNVHGGYIYAFIMLIPFIGLHLLTNFDKKWTAILYNVVAWPFLYLVLSKAGLTMPTFLFTVLVIVLDFVLIFFKKNLVSIGFRGVFHTIGAGFVAFVATIVFNPFHLTNLTHTFVISVSEHAARWRNIHEWRPAFHWGNLVGDERPFLIMYIIAWLTLAAWAGFLIFAPGSISINRKRKEKRFDKYQWPKIDIPLILIAALTIYMAIRSRRFIPIAAIAACPVIAMFIDQLVRGISAVRNFQKKNRLAVPAMPKNMQLACIGLGSLAVIFFGTWWGLKFKLIYLDSWPRDPKFNSVFMRMTDSSQKPFYACKFIRDNNLKGKMFNYWTEGGFIAFGQEPDPNNGRTPLRLFMDGRAQAAYDRDAFDVWTHIMAGGRITYRIVMAAQARGKELTSANYVEIGQWMDEQLREHNVWAVLMPQTTYSTPPRHEYYQKTSYHAVQGLERNLNWPLVFFNNKQKLFVDVRTPQGRELYNGIFSGKTIYPDEYHRNLICAHSWLYYRRGTAENKKGFDFAVKAFNSNPSPAPMREIILVASRFKERQADVRKFCEDYLRKFKENESDWSEQDGHRDRIEVARLACFYLGTDARTQKNITLANSYGAQEREYLHKLVELSQTKRW